MEYGQQMKIHKKNTLNAMYHNDSYVVEREDKQTLIIDHNIGATNTTFSLTLLEPLRIDKLSDIYLESFTTYASDINTNGTGDGMAFILDIDQFNIQTNSTNELLFNKIYIPNEDSAGTNKTTVHKGKKLNYICSINPTVLHNITGSVTDCPPSGSTSNSFDTNGRFIAEFVIVARK